MLEMTLMSEDVNIKQAAIDILTILVEFSPSVIREYILQQSTDNGKTSYNIFYFNNKFNINQLLNS